MGRILTDLKETFRRGDIHLQYIYINVGVFILTTLLSVFLVLFNRNSGLILQYFELPFPDSAVELVYLYVYACELYAYPV